MVPTALEPNQQSAAATADLSGEASHADHPAGTTATCVDRQEIARLSDGTIEAMSREDLLHIVCSHGIPFAGPQDSARYQFQDLSTLRRLVALVRQCCRNAG